MDAKLFYTTYYDANMQPLFWDQVLAADYWEACRKAHAGAPNGIDEFSVIGPSDEEFPNDGRRVLTRNAHLQKLRNLTQRKRRVEMRRPEVPTSAEPVMEPPQVSFPVYHDALLFDCFVDDEGGAAAYRVSSKSAFVASIGDTLETIIAKALRSRLSPQHRHLIGLDPTNGNVVLRLDLGSGLTIEPTERLQ